jgi:hypothetical protein
VNRTPAALALTVLVFAVLLPVTLKIGIVTAQNNSYSILNVDHQIEVMYSGNVVIRETITMTGQATSGFLIGFPYKYGSYILKGVAFDSTGSLPMNVGVQLGNRSGFYGFEITLPEQSAQTFTVIFLLSNDLLSTTSSGYSLDFPAYPSFATGAARCNVTLSLPAGSSEVSVTKPDGDVNATNIIKDNLLAFTYSPAVATFSLPDGYIQQVDVKSLNRVITIYPTGEIRASDSFRIINKSTKTAATIKLDLPSDASDVLGKDEFGRTLGVSVTAKNGPITPADLALQSALGVGQSAKIKVDTVYRTCPPTKPHVSPSTSTFFQSPIILLRRHQFRSFLLRARI